MEIVNNRYRILKNLKHQKLVSTYLVSDLIRENQMVQLNIINSELVPHSLIEFYLSEFLNLISYNNKNLMKNYGFNVVSHIDNKPNLDEQFYYTSEYIEKSIDLLDFIKDMKQTEILDVFIEVCRAVYYLHLKGVTYKELNLSNIIVKTDMNHFQVLLKDIATVELERFIVSPSMQDTIFKTPKLLLGAPLDLETDMYALGVLLLVMLLKRPLNKKPIVELEIFIEEIRDNDEEDNQVLLKLLSIVEKLLSTANVYPYENLYAVLLEINEKSSSNYTIVSKEELEKLNFNTKIIGRDNEIDLITSAYDQMIKYKPTNKIFLVEGDAGTGKTRFLKEIEFLLGLKKANIYASFNLSENQDRSSDMWVDILGKLIADASPELIDKYETELMKYFPEMAGNHNISTNLIKENSAKYRLLNRISGFIYDSLKYRPGVIIIDNIQFADEFTIDTLSYFCTEVIPNLNVILLISVNEENVIDDAYVKRFIKKIKSSKHCSHVPMLNLDELKTSELIKGTLSMAFAPKNFAGIIFPKSYGNPLFISETIKDLFSRKIIRIDEDTGVWRIELPEEGEYNSLSIPNTIEQVMLNQLVDTDLYSLEILKVISIHLNAITIERISQFTHTSVLELERCIGELVKKGIIKELIEDYGNGYYFYNSVLKDIVYESMDEEEKRQKHKLAAGLLEKESKHSDSFYLKDILYHYEKAKVKEKVKKYSLVLAEMMKEQKNMPAEIEYRKKAISMDEQENIQQTIRLLLRIGSLLNDVGEMEEALSYYRQAEELAEMRIHDDALIEICIKTAEAYSNLYQRENQENYLRKAERLLTEHQNQWARLEIKRLRALNFLDDNILEEGTEICLEIIAVCDERYKETLGNTYRLLAYFYTLQGKVEDALLLYEKSIKILEAEGSLRGVVFANNNIGAIYSDVYDDTDKALSYFIKVKELSEEYGISTGASLALMNIADLYHVKYDYQEAYDAFKLALDKTLKIGFDNQVFFLYNALTNICIDMCQYAEANKYYKITNNYLEEMPNQGLNIVEYYKSSSFLYYVYGDFKKAEKYSNKAVEFYKNEINKSKIAQVIFSEIIKIRTKEIGNYHTSISKIIETAKLFPNPTLALAALSDAIIVLGEKGDVTNAQLLLSKLEKLDIAKLPEQLQAKYLYAKGLVETSNGEETLLNALKLASKLKNKNLIARITMQLGDYYFDNNDFYNAASFYLESVEVVKSLIQDVPTEHQLSYINNHYFSRSFIRLNSIKNILIEQREIANEHSRDFMVPSHDELSNLLKSNVTNELMENAEFMRFIKKQHLESFSNGIQDVSDILFHVSHDTIKNMEMVLNYLAAATLATKGIIVIEGERQDLNVISAIDENDSLPSSRFIFDKVKSTMLPTIVTNKHKVGNELSFLPEDIQACLCIPITNHSFELHDSGTNNSRNNPIGYLYLESDKVLNYFNRDGLESCMKFVHYLALLIDKYQLQFSASIDKLTGALTRKYLEDALQEVMERYSEEENHFSIIMFDLDKFKSINDRFGHQTGDEVLKKVAKIVKEHIGKKNLLGRYGGEEFTVILPGKNKDEAFTVAEEIREKVYNQNILGEKIPITISLGVTAYPNHGETIKELIEKADQALYVAKENGRNNCQLWDENFKNKNKPADKLSGIISGNEVQNARNILALVELVQLINKNVSKEEKIYEVLGRVIEIVEAQVGHLIIMEGGEIQTTYARKAKEQGWIDGIGFNKNTIKTVSDSKNGVYLIDWDDLDKQHHFSRIPEWNSILAVPIITHDIVKGVLYFSASTKVKEFTVDDLNMMNVFSEVLATIIAFPAQVLN